jgi:hypothetical protein
VLKADAYSITFVIGVAYAITLTGSKIVTDKRISKQKKRILLKVAHV